MGTCSVPLAEWDSPRDEHSSLPGALAARCTAGNLAALGLPAGDKLAQLEQMLFEPVPSAHAAAPLSPFLLQLWRKLEGSPVHDTDAKRRSDFLDHYLHVICPSSRPYRWPLPPSTREWFNQPVPVLGLDAAERKPAALTRYLSGVHRRNFPQLDLKARENYDSFLAWCAYEFLPSRKIPSELMPDDLAAYLSEPVEGFPAPFTRGMLAMERLRTRLTPEEIRSLPEARVAAIAFQLMGGALRTNDLRLLPPFLSRFWGARENDGLLTRFEAVEQILNQHSAPPRPGRRNRAPVSSAEDTQGWNPSLLLRSGKPPEIPVPNPPALHPVSEGIISYRDHKTVCGLRLTGSWTLAALRRTGLKTIDLEFDFSRRTEKEYRHNSRILGNFSRSVHVFSLNPEYLLECVACNLSRVQPRDYFIGQFFWELPEICRIHEPALDLVDEIWVASEFVAGIYRRRTSKPVVNVGTVSAPAGPDPDLTREDFGSAPTDYVFLTVFDTISSIERKNPLASIEAFRQAFPRGNERVKLIVKTHNLGKCMAGRDRTHWDRVMSLAARDWRIIVINETFSEPAMSSLYRAADCFVSLHRSEGFGNCVAEAMYHGRPVIVTGYSGVCDFCTHQTARLVDYRLIPVPRRHFPFLDHDRSYEWAEPNTATAARHMRELYEDRASGVEMGARGQALIRSRYSLDSMARRYRRRLAELGFGAE